MTKLFIAFIIALGVVGDVTTAIMANEWFLSTGMAEPIAHGLGLFAGLIVFLLSVLAGALVALWRSDPVGSYNG